MQGAYLTTTHASRRRLVNIRSLVGHQKRLRQSGPRIEWPALNDLAFVLNGFGPAFTLRAIGRALLGLIFRLRGDVLH
jgi:hypothetical protein